MRFEIEKTIFVIDSQIGQSMIKKESYGFNTFVAVRIGEIQETSGMESWYWIEGSVNIADWITRGKELKELGSERSILLIHGQFTILCVQESYQKKRKLVQFMVCKQPRQFVVKLTSTDIQSTEN